LELNLRQGYNTLKFQSMYFEVDCGAKKAKFKYDCIAANLCQ